MVKQEDFGYQIAVELKYYIKLNKRKALNASRLIAKICPSFIGIPCLMGNYNSGNHLFYFSNTLKQVPLLRKEVIFKNIIKEVYVRSLEDLYED